MKRLLIIYSILTLVGSLSCKKADEGDEALFIEQIRNTVNFRKTSEISIYSVPMPAWDKLYIIAPYTSKEMQRSIFGLDANRIGNTGIDMRDDIVVLVFTTQGRVIDIVQMPRKVCDFSALASPNSIDRTQAVFKLEYQDGFARAVRRGE